MNTLEILIAARVEIEKGWCKHALEDINGNCCALGALDRVRGLGTEAGKGVRRALPPEYDRSIVAFNNDPTTTQADVLALFDRAINAEAAKVTTNADRAHVHATVA
jgi:hypothetical protein